jgi:hypothetical protein
LQAYNRFAYALNNPLRFVDPLGYAPEPPGQLSVNDSLLTYLPDDSLHLLDNKLRVDWDGILRPSFAKEDPVSWGVSDWLITHGWEAASFQKAQKADLGEEFSQAGVAAAEIAALIILKNRGNAQQLLSKTPFLGEVVKSSGARVFGQTLKGNLFSRSFWVGVGKVVRTAPGYSFSHGGGMAGLVAGATTAGIGLDHIFSAGTEIGEAFRLLGERTAGYTIDDGFRIGWGRLLEAPDLVTPAERRRLVQPYWSRGKPF